MRKRRDEISKEIEGMTHNRRLSIPKKMQLS
jgi:hypothetical protein